MVEPSPKTTAGTEAVLEAIGTSNTCGRLTSAIRVAVGNLEATELAGLPSIAHVIRSLKEALRG